MPTRFMNFLPFRVREKKGTRPLRKAAKKSPNNFEVNPFAACTCRASFATMDAADELQRSFSESETSDRSEEKEALQTDHSFSFKSNRFNPRQRAILESYYRTGMVDTGKVYTFRHLKAAREVGCTVDKVKIKALCVTL